MRKVDEAIRRRFHLIPFTVTIPAEERDKDLAEKLRDEWPGILAWAILGAGLWFKHGLEPPAVVRDATDAYLEAEDSLGTWITEECLTGQDYHTDSTTLFEAWTKWCGIVGEMAGSQKQFSQNLQERGFRKQRMSGGSKRNGFLGIAPKGQRHRGSMTKPR